jgi:serine/threonine-protein kinase
MEKAISAPTTQTSVQAPPAPVNDAHQNATTEPVVKKEVTIYDVKPAQSAASRVRPEAPLRPPPSSTPEAPPAATPATPVANNINPEVDAEALEKTKERMIQLGTRAAAVKNSIDRLRADQAAGGLGLRQDIAATLGRMSVYMDEAEHALNTGDLKLSEKRADQAEKEITSLEEFTGR